MRVSPMSAPQKNMTCNRLWVLLLFMTRVFGWGLSSSNVDLNDDVLGLIVFKAGLQDPNGELNSWNEDDESPCKWKYVKCNPRNGRVTEVVLEGLGLSGKIGRGLEKVECLKRFSVSRNNFTGDLSLFDAQIASLTSLDLSFNGFSGKIPVGFSNMSSLRSLDLSNNELSGVIPEDIFMASLRSLSLAGNLLVGSVPVAVENCIYLRRLNLSRNHITDLGFESLWKLGSLRILDLSFNNYSGPLPLGIGGQHGLREVYLQRNGFTGPFPHDIGGCLQLRVMDWSQNQLSGELPESLQALNNVVSVRIQQNRLEGALPPWVGSLSNVEELDLSNNRLRGKLPDSLGLLKSLKIISLSNNEFSETIPTSLANCSNLSSIDLSNNRLSGKIPVDLFGLGLETVNLSFNNLSGYIPSGASHLYWFLQVLDLSSNKLNGGIPVNLSLCFNMRFLNLSWNALEATIPPQLGNLRFLQVLDLGHNRLYGNIPPWLFHSEDLLFLLLNHNSLWGGIPTDIANCTSLYGVSLSNNHLEGPIPAEVTKLQYLESLNLSHNNLTGILPRQLANLQNLMLLDVSYNQLQGRIPTQGIFKRLNKTSFEGNKNLCGENFNISCRKYMPKPIVMNPHGNSFGGHGSSGIIGGNHKRVGLSASAIVAISAGAAIAVGIIIITILNIQTQSHLISGESSVDSGTRSFHSDTAVGKLVMFSPNSDIVAEKWVNNAHALLRKGSEIGKGGFGSVYKTSLDDGRVVAVKRLMVSDTVKSQEAFEKEVQLLGKIKHPNLVSLKGYYWTPQQQLLIYDYVTNGSLYRKLHEKPESSASLNWQTRFKIAMGVARGLAHLHHATVPPIIHYNLKSTNVLLDEDCNPRVTDYGLAKLLPELDQYILNTKFQTVSGYTAPEFGCQSKRVTEKCDVFGFGVIVLELVTGRKAVEYMEDDVIILCDYVRSLHARGDVLSCVDPTLQAYPQAEIMSMIKLGLMCTSQVPSARPSMPEVVQILEIISNPSESRERI